MRNGQINRGGQTNEQTNKRQTNKQKANKQTKRKQTNKRQTNQQKANKQDKNLISNDKKNWFYAPLTGFFFLILKKTGLMHI